MITHPIKVSMIYLVHVNAQDKREARTRVIRIFHSTDIYTDDTHGRRQLRVCTDLGGCIQPISRQNQQASRSANIDVPSLICEGLLIR